MSPVLVALDFSDVGKAVEVADSVREHVTGFKVGLELLMAAGPAALDRVIELRLPVFADVKLHDIPNTVQHAAARLADRGVRWITVHAAGGREMIGAAVSGMGDETGVLAVTVLTSIDATDFEDIGIGRTLTAQVEAMARLASEVGVEGVICSPHEASGVKLVDDSLLTVTPGIRPLSSQADDQKRVMTPVEAVAARADLLVIGRPITAAEDPAEAAASIAADLSS